MNKSAETLKKVSSYLKKYKYVTLIIVIGIVLILIPPKESTSKEKSVSAPALEFDLADEEARIAQAISKMTGAGKVTVVLTLQSTMETVYQTDMTERSDVGQSTQRNDKETRTVTVSAGSGAEQAAVVRKKYPIYQGALIVCDGADRPDVKLNIVGAVSSLTGLPSNKITVVKAE